MSGVARSLTADQVTLHDRQRELGPDGERNLVALFTKAYPAGARVLDAGGGSGVAVPALRAAGLQPVLVDLSVAMLRAAAGRGVARVQADLLSLPLRTGCVDGVHAAYVLPNISEWRRAGAQLARALVPHGVALIAFGAPPADPVVSELSRRHFTALADAGATRVGMPAEATGMRSVEDAQRELAALGLRATGVHEVTGVQDRSYRELVGQWSRNPFAVNGGPPVLAAAEAVTLAWAAAELGDLDRSRTVRIRHVLHEFTRD